MATEPVGEEPAEYKPKWFRLDMSVLGTADATCASVEDIIEEMFGGVGMVIHDIEEEPEDEYESTGEILRDVLSLVDRVVKKQVTPDYVEKTYQELLARVRERD